MAATLLAFQLRPALARAETLWGASAAWALQAVAFAALYRALARGGRALRAWIAGMGARAGGLALAFVAVTAGPADPALGIAFGLSLLGLLLLEAAWLALDAPHGAGRQDEATERGGEGRSGTARDANGWTSDA